MIEYSVYSLSTLLNLVKQGDEHAYGELFNRYWGRMYLHAYKILQDGEAAEDVVQEGFIHLWEIRDNLEIQGNFEAYLHTMVRNRVLNCIRNQRVRSNYTSLFSQYLTHSPNPTLETIQGRELQQLIDNAIKALPDRMREIFELSRNEGLSHKEIASQMGIRPSTVKRQISTALRVLKENLKGHEALLWLWLFGSHM